MSGQRYPVIPEILIECGPVANVAVLASRPFWQREGAIPCADLDAIALEEEMRNSLSRSGNLDGSQAFGQLSVLRAELSHSDSKIVFAVALPKCGIFLVRAYRPAEAHSPQQATGKSTRCNHRLASFAAAQCDGAGDV